MLCTLVMGRGGAPNESLDPRTVFGFGLAKSRLAMDKFLIDILNRGKPHLG